MPRGQTQHLSISLFLFQKFLVKKKTLVMIDIINKKIAIKTLIIVLRIYRIEYTS